MCSPGRPWPDLQTPKRPWSSLRPPAPAEAISDGSALLYRAFAGAVIGVAADVAAVLGGALMSLGRSLFS
jgi:hypothetical protein